MFAEISSTQHNLIGRLKKNREKRKKGKRGAVAGEEGSRETVVVVVVVVGVVVAVAVVGTQRVMTTPPLSRAGRPTPGSERL